MTDYETLRRLAADMADTLADYAREARRGGSEPDSHTLHLLRRWQMACGGRRATPRLGDRYVGPAGLVQEVRAIWAEGVVLGWGEGEAAAGQCVGWDELQRLWRPLDAHTAPTALAS